jgi:hypothetical protein
MTVSGTCFDSFSPTAMPCAPAEVLIHHSYLLFPNVALDLPGAKTQVGKGHEDVLIVDHVERPSEN